MKYSNSDRQRLPSERFRNTFVFIALFVSLIYALYALVRGGRSIVSLPEFTIENRQPKGGRIYRWEYRAYQALVSLFPAVISAYAVLAPQRESNCWLVFSNGGWDDRMNWLWWVVIGLYVFFVFGIIGIASRATDKDHRDACGRRSLYWVGLGMALIVILSLIGQYVGSDFSEIGLGITAITVLIAGILSTEIGRIFFKLHPHAIREP